MIEFQIGNEKTALDVGSSYRVDPHSCYRDTSQEKVSETLVLMEDGLSWKDAVGQIFAKTNPWLHAIVTHPSRSKFLKDNPPNPHDLVLDIGAGWGQTALPLARSNKVCALEPTPERLDFIHAAAKQEDVDKNLYFLGADYLEVNFQTRFDLILSIGVLEWVGAFRPDMKPEETQQSFLAKIRRELNDGGRLVIGIENRLGLKYLMGCRDDHVGLADVTTYDKETAKEKYRQETKSELRCLTHTLEEYRIILKEAGFESIQFQAAIPDYKLPEEIFPISNGQCDWNDSLRQGDWIRQHDGFDGTPLPNQKELRSHYVSLAQMGIAHYFAPSFFITAKS